MEAREIIEIWQKHGVEVLPHFTELEVCKEIAEISFKAGRQEVAEWVEEHKHSIQVKNSNPIRYILGIAEHEWQAFKKSKGIK